MIRHVFLWRVAEDADANQIIDILNQLPGRVPGIRSWALGAHQGEPGESGDPWDYALTCDFDSMEDLQGYSEHPFHKEVVERLLPMFADRAVCDFEL